MEAQFYTATGIDPKTLEPQYKAERGAIKLTGGGRKDYWHEFMFRELAIRVRDYETLSKFMRTVDRYVHTKHVESKQAQGPTQLNLFGYKTMSPIRNARNAGDIWQDSNGKVKIWSGTEWISLP